MPVYLRYIPKWFLFIILKVYVLRNDSPRDIPDFAIPHDAAKNRPQMKLWLHMLRDARDLTSSVD